MTVVLAETSALTIEPYSAERGREWNDFVARAKNGVFLFDRNYLEYHSDRFVDASVLIRDGEKLLALLPASRHGETIVSHGGLTFGGVVSDARMRTGTMLRIFDALLEFWRRDSVHRVVYKAVPHMYHDVPAEEDLYALFRMNARLTRRDVAAAIRAGEGAGYTKGRKWSVKRGRAAGVQIGRSDQFEQFMDVERDTLRRRHGVDPVHTGAEMRLLATRFPDNIKLFTATRDGGIVAGVIVYESRRVAHAQYIASTDEGRELFALDALLDHVINDVYGTKPYFDFGISTEQQGRYLNAGLMDNKEGYGGRAAVYDFYELELA